MSAATVSTITSSPAPLSHHDTHNTLNMKHASQQCPPGRISSDSRLCTTPQSFLSPDRHHSSSALTTKPASSSVTARTQSTKRHRALRRPFPFRTKKTKEYSPPPSSHTASPIVSPSQHYARPMCLSSLVLVFALVAFWRFVALVATLLLVVTVCLSLPEVLGHLLSYIVSEWALYGEVEMKFQAVRLALWIETQRRCFGDDVRLRGDDDHDQHQDEECRDPTEAEAGTCCAPCCVDELIPCELTRRVCRTIDGMLRDAWRVTSLWLSSKRLRLDIRVAQVSFGNPKHSSKWCRDYMCAATDLAVDFAITLGDLVRASRHLFTHWSPFPRDQHNPSFAAVRDDKTKTMRNSTMLGVLNVERFEMGDAHLAFEQCEGRLNIAAIGRRLATAEIAYFGSRHCHKHTFTGRAARLFGNVKLNRIRVEVLAARDLDQAFTSAVGAAHHHHYKPSTFARVAVRAQQRRSRTIMRHSSPVFAYKPDEPIFVTDPSSVINVTVFEESYLGDSIVGQWATSLKRLILDVEQADGGRDLVKIVEEDALEWRGWLPLRDAKWRTFRHVHKYATPKHSGQDVNFADDSMTAVSLDANEHDAHYDPRDSPAPGYPAVLVRLRWETDPSLAEDFDETRALTALEQMTYNSAETMMRCGNQDILRGMLASFPLWFDVRRGFRIYGTATAHVRDLFLGTQGGLERRRNKHGTLLDSDWRAVKRKAITLQRVDVAFPRTRLYGGEAAQVQYLIDDASSSLKRHHRGLSVESLVASVFFGVRRTTSSSSSSSDPESESTDAEADSLVPERPGLLTLDGAASALFKGIIDKILASGRVATSIAEVFSALSYGALTTSKGKPFVHEDMAAAAVEAAAEAASLPADTAQPPLPLNQPGVDPQPEAADERTAPVALVPSSKLKSRAARVPFKVKGFLRFNGTRSDRQFARLVGYKEPSHKRMDARTVEDLYKPVKACGVLLKTSRPPGVVGARRWKPYRCVLRGATLFYFEVCAPTGPGSQRRYNHDKIIDLHRVVADVPSPVVVDENHENGDVNLRRNVLDAHQRTSDEHMSYAKHCESDNQSTPKPPSLCRRSSTSLLVKLQQRRSGAREIFLGTRLDGGAVHHTYLRVPSRTSKSKADTELKRIEATAWDDEAWQALQAPSTLDEWYAAIVQAVCEERARAHAEIAKIEADYRRKQEHEIEQVGGIYPRDDADPELVHVDRSLAAVARRGRLRGASEDSEEATASSTGSDECPGERKECGDLDSDSDEDSKTRRSTITMGEDAHLLFEDSSTTSMLGDCRVTVARPFGRASKSTRPRPTFACNGAWELTKRGSGLDAILASEGVSFGTRVLMSASAATLWFSVDNVRAVVHMQEGLFAHRFVGPLNTPIHVRKFAGRETSPFVVDTVSVSPDGNELTLVQTSPANGKVVCTAVWSIAKTREHLEQRIVRAETPANYTPGLFLTSGQYDEYRRASLDRAVKIELAAAC